MTSFLLYLIYLEKGIRYALPIILIHIVYIATAKSPNIVVAVSDVRHNDCFSVPTRKTFGDNGTVYRFGVDANAV